MAPLAGPHCLRLSAQAVNINRSGLDPVTDFVTAPSAGELDVALAELLTRAGLSPGQYVRVSSVARAVRSYCIPEYERVVHLQSEDMNPEAQDQPRL